MEARSYFIRAGGYGTHVLEAGDADVPPVLLVHDGAFGTDASLCWGAVIEELAEDRHVFAPDLLGWGGSDKVCFFDRSPYDFRLQHLADVCRTLCLDEPIDVVGVSFGGDLVARGVAEPRWGWSVRQAVAITGTGGRMYRVPGAIEQLSDYEPSLAAAERLTAKLVERADGLDDHVRRRYENSLIPGHWEALSALRLRNPAVERTIPPDDWPAPLAACETPILYVEGRRDELLEPGWAAEMAAVTGRGSSVVVDGGHEPNIDHPGRVVEVIREFLTSTG